MRRWFFFAYGLACHGLFLGVYAWMAAFVGNFGFGVLPTIDGPAEDPIGKAVVIDVLLVAAFAVQHSVMARPWFKRRWTRIIPEPIERSTYVLASCLAVAVLMWQWRPIGGVVWDIADPAWRTLLHGVFVVGWVMVPAVSLLINHFDLFGTRQVYLHLRGRDYTQLAFRTPGIYRYVRHPLYVGWIIAFWATPTMTVTHLLFAAFLTLYILAAIPFEERDLESHFGDTYRRYRGRVGALIPRLLSRSDQSQAPDGRVA